MECDDNNSCTVGDVCGGGVCAGPMFVECDDGNDCMKDVCDLLTGCTMVPFDGVVCDDGDFCAGSDQCVLDVCMAGLFVVCDDKNVCMVDTCVVDFGCFYLVKDGVFCDDGSSCSIELVCVEEVCVPTVVLDCDDQNPCTIDTCDELVGCRYESVFGMLCEDFNFCTEGDVCGGVWCAGTFVLCSDDDFCTIDECMFLEGCVIFYNIVFCEDGDVCITGDMCTVGECIGGLLLLCDDGDVCIEDVCEFGIGCVFADIVFCCGNIVIEEGEACDDGN